MLHQKQSKTMSSILLLMSLFLPASGDCPEQCICDIDNQGRKRVTCSKGGMTEIPTLKMDADIHILSISAPENRHNRLAVGRIFQDFFQLEEIHIAHSMLPAIGDSSFWPGKKIKILDLSHNNISFIRDRDFIGLQNLRILDLSYNHIAASPSAPFRLLTSLTTLSLARNRLKTLVPRFFYMLIKLEKLDLTGNPLKDVDPENLKDIKPLRRLHLAKCQLERLHSLTYQQLPNLEELDLRDNHFTYFSPEEFRHLRRLRYLHLDGNNLTVIVEKTFDGHTLRHLGLSRNKIFRLAKCAFCNLSIQQLDLSHNLLTSLPYDVLYPVAHSLESLDLSHNVIYSEDLELALSPVYKLRRLSLSGMDIAELSDDAFFNAIQLKTLDLSYNVLSNFSTQTFLPLKQVEEIDLSHNEIQTLDQTFLDLVQNLSHLSVLHLHSNPWSCHQCSVHPLLKWIRESPIYSSTCDTQYDSSTCMRCATPSFLEGRTLHSLKNTDLPPCSEVLPQSHILKVPSGVPLLVITIIGVLFLFGAGIAILVYHRQGAVYYTKEQEHMPHISHHGEYVVANGNTISEYKRRAYFVTLDRIDEISGEKVTITRNSS